MLAATTIEGEVILFDGVDGRELTHVLDPTRGWITGVVISPQGQWVASASIRGVVQWSPLAQEDRKPDRVTADARCHIPLELRDAQLIAHKLSKCSTN